MREIKFRVWYKKESKMYYRGYQKLSFVLLCDDDRGANEGKGRPVKRASYEDCEFLEGTDVLDKNGVEIFEGDMLTLRTGQGSYQGVLESVPDMFKSRRLHPLHDLLQALGIPDDEKDLELEIIGNRYEGPSPQRIVP